MKKQITIRKSNLKNKLLCLLCAVALMCSGCGSSQESGGATETGSQSQATVQTEGSETSGTENDADTTETNGGEATGTEATDAATDSTGAAEDASSETAKDASEAEEDLSEVSLKEYCKDYFTLGVGINGSTLDNLTLHSEEYMALVKQHFNSCTLSNLMKSAYILKQEESIQNALEGDGSPVLTFESIDPTLQWCMDNGVGMRGHTLVWHVQSPDWFFREGYTDDGAYVDKDTMLFRMESYICQLMTHVQDNYPGVVYCWDVVNEAVDPDKGDPDSAFSCRMENEGTPNPWYITIGEDYVEMAFTYARKYVADGVKLFYNDFNTYDTKKREYIYTLCEGLKEKGLIDGIGMQGYWGTTYPSMAAIEGTILRFAKLELELQITELTVSVDEETEEQFADQAQRYFNIFYSLHNLDIEGGGSANITNVTFFGLKDHYNPNDTTNARLFDTDFQPKPAFIRVRDILKAIYK